MLGGKPQCCCILLEDAEKVLRLLPTVWLAFREQVVLRSRMALKVLNTTDRQWSTPSDTPIFIQQSRLTASLDKKGGTRWAQMPRTTTFSAISLPENEVLFCIKSDRWPQPQLPRQNLCLGERTAGNSSFQGRKLLLPPQETRDSVLESDF